MAEPRTSFSKSFNSKSKTFAIFHKKLFVLRLTKIERSGIPGRLDESLIPFDATITRVKSRGKSDQAFKTFSFTGGISDATIICSDVFCITVRCEFWQHVDEIKCLRIPDSSIRSEHRVELALLCGYFTRRHDESVVESADGDAR